MRGTWAVVVVCFCGGIVEAQPALTETVEYPPSRPGPGVAQSGFGCFHLAGGAITPGDVDWVQITIPRASTQTVVDVDFPANGGGSALLASIVNGGTAFNISDNNNARDALCGLHNQSVPLGSPRDSAANLNATTRNVIVNIGITGAADISFVGAHSETFTYDVWVYAATLACTSDGDCTDGVTCTVDTCNTINGACANDADDAACDNQRFCDGVEFCDAVRDCRSGPQPDCDDGVSCTDDECSLATDDCVHQPDDGLCDNGTFCDGEEWCDAQLDCQSGDPPTCDDDVGCTVDECDLTDDACVHAPEDLLCNDRSFCNGLETCDPVNDCQAGVAPSCDDNVSCTVDSCDADLDDCVSVPDDARCDNGRFCDGEGFCDPSFGCRSGERPDCDDGVECTADACDSAVDACVHTPEDSRCDDGRFCNGLETCDAVNDCQAGVAPSCDDNVPCTVDSCDPDLDDCISAPEDGRCDNGRFCDGEEFCDPSLGCRSGERPDCDDGVECTADVCDSAVDACMHTPEDARCDDGRSCNGLEMCDALTDCRPGVAQSCDDHVSCTVDSCDTVTGECEYVPDDKLCDNGVFCDGAEVCDPAIGCRSGDEPCPDQFCRDTEPFCVDCLEDGDCDDGDFCNGQEMCDPAGMCEKGAPPCPPDMICNSKKRRCEKGHFTLDVKPGACPNRVALAGNGYMAMAVTGSPGADVRNIRIKSLRLSRVDGLGESLTPNLGKPGPVPKVHDVATPWVGGVCGCHAVGGDGIADLVVHFDESAMVKKLALDQVKPGSQVPLQVWGQLTNGFEFQVTDCIIVPRRRVEVVD